MLRLTFLVSLLVFVAGCGYKTDLTLPDQAVYHNTSILADPTPEPRIESLHV